VGLLELLLTTEDQYLSSKLREIITKVSTEKKKLKEVHSRSNI